MRYVIELLEDQLKERVTEHAKMKGEVARCADELDGAQQALAAIDAEVVQLGDAILRLTQEKP